MTSIPWRAWLRWSVWATAMLVALPHVARAAGLAQEALPSPAVWSVLASVLALCFPLGMTLIAAAGLPELEAREAALSLIAALGLGALGYWAIGFGLQFGGVGLAYDQPGLEGLVWAWTPLPPSWGPGWAVMGLRGFGLAGAAATPAAYALFLAFLPWAITATLIPLLALRGRAPTPVSLLAGLGTGAVLYPLAGQWVWGGGWLAELGINLELGHGFIDFAGATPVHLVGAAVGLAGILVAWPLRRRAPVVREVGIDVPLSHGAPVSLANGPVSAPSAHAPALPPVHLPLLAVVGAGLVLIGSVGWALANPLVDWNRTPIMLAALNAILAAAAGAVVPSAYTWFVASRPDPLMAARGLLAGAVAGSAIGPFAPPTAAVLAGLVAGVLAAAVLYGSQRWLGWDDRAAIVSASGTGALWGGFLTSIVADGRWGQGWNQIGRDIYLNVDGQGVTGLLAAAGLRADWPGQIQAQLVGLVAIGLFAFVGAWVLFVLVALAARALSS